MNNLTVVIVILLTSNLPSALCLLGEGLRGAPPCITSGHVQRAAYILPYFRLSLWSPILWRPLCGEPSGACFTVRRLIVAAAHDS